MVDSPLGSYHWKQDDIFYPINYGYGKGIIAPENISFIKEEFMEQVRFQEQ